MTTILQTYQATIAFLDTWYFRYYSNDLGSLLGDTRLFKDSDNWQDNPQTVDPIMWHNWKLAVDETKNKSPYTSDSLDSQEAFTALKQFLWLYTNSIQSQELNLVYQELQTIKTTSAIWNIWLLCLLKAQNNQLDTLYDSLIGQHTTVNLQQATTIMHYFTQNQLSTDTTIVNATIALQNLATHPTTHHHEWYATALKQAYLLHGFQLHENVTILSLFKIWVEFLESYSKQFQLNTVPNITKTYAYFDNGQPKDYMIYYYWLQSFHQVLYPI